MIDRAQSRLPAEWEPQSAVLLAWPHARTDWASRLSETRSCYERIIATLRRYEPVILLVHETSGLDELARRFEHGARPGDHPVRCLHVPFNDTWLRDSGPITVLTPKPRWLDFRFDAWGGKFEHDLDDALVDKLHRTGAFSRIACQRFDWVLEGGAIDSDGQGTLLTTSRCLTARFPGESRDAIGKRLSRALGVERVLWLAHGELLGDDTDGHVDTLARFADPRTIVYQGCSDPEDEHYPELDAMAGELGRLRRADGQPYRLLALPLPAPISEGGTRLPAGYANFLVLNGAVVMPSYGDPADGQASAVLRQAFPDREVATVDCRELIRQGGSLHCVTMHLPAEPAIE